jgi:outer membrane receptor protein involved in Fe transport
MKQSLPLRRKLLATLIRSAVITAAIVPVMSWAQSSDATLRGKAAPNMQVTAKNIATGAVRHTNTAADGSYSLVSLPPGTYVVDAGPGTERTVTLTVASTATLDFGTGTPAPVGSTGATTLGDVSVTATTLTEVKTSEIGTNISLHQIQTIPQITRNFLEFADTVPGMSFEVKQGKTSIQSGAQANNNINVYIDGVGQKNYIHSGGISGQAGSNHDGDPGNPFPQLAIGEYKVITSNYKAEYDQISSAAITAETKSGTNEFHGEVFGDYTDQNYRSSTPAEEAAGGQKAVSANKEWGLAVGGPIIQDTLHYFFTYEKKQFSTPTTTNPPSDTYNGQPFSVFLPADVQSQFGPSAKPFDEDLYFGKLDWEISDRDRVELSSKVRKESQINGAQDQVAPSASYNYQNNDTRIDGRWQHSADSWTNEVLVTYEKTLDNPTPITDQPATEYVWQPNNARVILINGQDPRQYFLATQEGYGIQDNLTFSDLNWNGDHVVKMGVKYKDVTLKDRDSSAGALYSYFVSPDGTESIPYRTIFGKVNSGLPLTATSKDKQFGLYIQDDWAVNEHLTLNLGVRWDYEDSPSFVNYRTPANIVSAINSQDTQGNIKAPPGQTYAQTLALGGININDYVSTGNNRSVQKNEFQPRVGFSYDLNGDESHVVFGGAGRAYDRNLFDVLSLENSKNALSQPQINFQNRFGANGCPIGAAPTPTCVAWDPKYLDPANLQSLGTGVGEVDMFNNNIKAPYSDQFSIGMRNKLGDWNTSATIARINSYNGIIGQLGNRYGNGAFYDSTGNQWGSGGVPGIGSLILFDNGKETRNTQLLLSAELPYTKESGWGMTAAYTYTDATQNRLYTDGYAFDLPKIGDYPFLTSSAAPKHRLVLSGSYDGPWGLLFAGKLVLETPTPVADIAGGIGNIVPNPIHAPNYPVVGVPSGESFLFGGPVFGYRDIDVQATKNFDLTRGMNLYLRLDVLNLMNYKNYSDTINTWLVNGALNPDNPVVYNGKGNIVGIPRTFKFTMGFRW